MDHYFTNNIVKHDRKIINIIFKGINFKFNTDSGVFSKEGLDFGTRSLLETIPFDSIKGKILDFGCGYGPIGIIVSKLTNQKVDMIDINKRSINLSKENAKLNDVEVNIFESDIYSNVNEEYDYIITNPPIRVGNEILYKILFEAEKHLKKDGQLWLVVNKNQGAKTIAKNLEKIYNVQIINKNKGFFTILCSK